MSTAAVTAGVVAAVIVILIAPVYAGLYFSKKSIEKRRQREEMHKKDDTAMKEND
jgi:uncharacterized membrane protein (DUF485 family)